MNIINFKLYKITITNKVSHLILLPFMEAEPHGHQPLSILKDLHTPAFLLLYHRGIFTM